MIIIIGAGLSGLVTAFRLKQAKMPFKILEARDRIGGRIFTKVTAQDTPVEMGATWFGEQHQNLIQFLNEIEVSAFTQFQGKFYYYDGPNSVHHGKYPLPQQEPSYRISGGSKRLIEKLYQAVGEEDIEFNNRVTEVIKEQKDFIIKTADGMNYRADQLILALPPKIWAHQIHFEPSLPEELLYTAKNTQTWMEDSIKASVEFNEPFWRENENPSTIMSNYGPFVECYDHSNQQENRFALCGFLNPVFKDLEHEERKTQVLKQLSKILGEKALDAVSYHEYIWSEDDYVKWPKDILMTPHQNNGHPIFRKSYLNEQLFLSGSESATGFPGYMDGAVEAGENAFKQVCEKIKAGQNHQGS